MARAKLIAAARQKEVIGLRKTVRIDILSHAHHLNQPLLGFHLWAKEKGYTLELRDCVRNSDYKLRKTALVVYLDHSRLVYDMADGYQSPDAMAYLLKQCDFYFKRSCSDVINRDLGYQNVVPYGLNYDVTWAGNPLARKRRGGWARTIYESATGKMITPISVENKPDWEKDKKPVALFLTRLWPQEKSLSDSENDERRKINQTRVQIIRLLRENYPRQAIAGLIDNETDRKTAPDLIIPGTATVRDRYLRTMKKADICIATTGLYGSIGGRFGEYVAASRAIVSEKLHYTVPGAFFAGKNYFEFETPDQCMEQIQQLTNQPENIGIMQQANREYYLDYLQPKELIRNTLRQAGIEGETK